MLEFIGNGLASGVGTPRTLLARNKVKVSVRYTDLSKGWAQTNVNFVHYK